MSSSRPISPTAPAVETPRALAALLALLAMIAPLSINMYLPALPAMSGAFGVDVPRMQLSVGVFLLGLGIGQWVGAPVSDRYGRRPTTLAGMAIFGAATAGLVFCRSADPFVALRTVQGLGAGVSIVNIGAVVGDLFSIQEGARKLTTIALIQAAGRLAAPAMGVLLLGWLGWRAIFHALLLYCALVALLLAFALPETAPRARTDEDRALFRVAIGNYRRVLRLTPAFAYALCLSFSTACMFVYLADAAFIYMDWFGVGPGPFSGLLALNVVAAGFFTAVNFRLLGKLSAHRIVPFACAIQCLATGTLLAHVTLMTPSLPVVVALLMCSMGVGGMIVGNAGVCFLAHFPDIRATASGVAGSVQFLVGGLAGTVLGVIHTGTLAATASIVTLSACVALLSLRFAGPPAKAESVPHE